MEEMVFALSFKNEKNKEVRGKIDRINNILINRWRLLDFLVVY